MFIDCLPSEQHSTIVSILTNFANDGVDKMKMEIIGALRQPEQRAHTSRNLPIFNQSRAELHNTGTLTAISEKLSLLTERVSEQKRLDVLSSLDLGARRDRQSNIKDMHQHTYKWIFKKSCPEPGHSLRSQLKFQHWLQSGSGIYWISGKARSGKSTLMKYIVGNSQTREDLQYWAGSAKVVITSCFLWHAGDPLQRSLPGLLQSLLYDILRQCPSLISNVCYNRFHHHAFSSVRWSQQEFSEAFERLNEHATFTRFCFSIDGLDEYGHDHLLLIEAIQDLVKSSNLKICLSSRP